VVIAVRPCLQHVEMIRDLDEKLLDLGVVEFRDRQNGEGRCLRATVCRVFDNEGR